MYAGKQFLPQEEEDFEFTQLAKLVAQESFTPEGEVAVIDLVQRLYAERVERVLEARAIELKQKPAYRSMLDGTRLEIAKKEYQHVAFTLNVETVTGRAPRQNFIVSRGDLETAQYNALFLSHVDTVVPSAENMLTLRRNKDNPDKVHGLGAWDEKQAVLNTMALAAEVYVPPGVAAHFAVVTDEEDGSLGMKALLKDWSGAKNLDAIFSSEIGELPEGIDDADERVRVILGRPGRQKMRVKIQVSDRATAHFSSTSRDHNASDLKRDLMEFMMVRFQISQGNNRHSLMKPPWWESREEYSKISKPGRQPDVSGFDFAIHALPGITHAEQMDFHQQSINEFRKLKKIPTSVSITIGDHTEETSYDAFCMPIRKDGHPLSHPLSDIVFDGVSEVTGFAPVPVAGKSVADENLGAQEIVRLNPKRIFGDFHGVFSFPPRGNNAHNAGEWVSFKDIFRVRAIQKWLIESTHGFLRLARKKGIKKQ